jgi:hypothetical protein
MKVTNAQPGTGGGMLRQLIILVVVDEIAMLVGAQTAPSIPRTWDNKAVAAPGSCSRFC